MQAFREFITGLPQRIAMLAKQECFRCDEVLVAQPCGAGEVIGAHMDGGDVAVPVHLAAVVLLGGVDGANLEADAQLAHPVAVLVSLMVGEKLDAASAVAAEIGFDLVHDGLQKGGPLCQNRAVLTQRARLMGKRPQEGTARMTFSGKTMPAACMTTPQISRSVKRKMYESYMKHV